MTNSHFRSSVCQSACKIFVIEPKLRLQVLRQIQAQDEELHVFATRGFPRLLENINSQHSRVLSLMICSVAFDLIPAVLFRSPGYVTTSPVQSLNSWPSTTSPPPSTRATGRSSAVPGPSSWWSSRTWRTRTAASSSVKFLVPSTALLTRRSTFKWSVCRK